MIIVEDNAVSVDGIVLPGILKSIEIKADAAIEEQEVEGSAAKGKQATGYEDAKVNLELILDDTISQSKYQKLATIQNLFRSPGQKVPTVHSLVNEDTSARGVSRVVFKSLSHKHENKKGQLPVTLEFWEYVPVVISAKKKSKSSSGSSSTITTGYQKYLEQHKGQFASSGSPASDSASLRPSAISGLASLESILG